jgi:hypothetical protein
MRIITVCLIPVVLLLSVTFASPHKGSKVELRIIPDRGGTFLTIPFEEFKEGNTSVIKKYLEARKSENYTIVIKNKTPDRIGVVIAVDGRNIISGKTSYLRNNERMYIINPYGSLNLEGWRADLSTVNRFYFTDEEDSYSVRTFKDSSAMGVIAAAVYKEKDRLREHHKKRESKKNTFRAPSAPSDTRDLKSLESESAGTGYGDDTYSPAVRVHFNPERTPVEKILVKYEWHDALCSKGILKCGEKKNRLWDDYGFAPPPPDYVTR